jgi:hypothetical protein
MEATDQLDRLIERRSDAAPDPDEREESYMESVRRFHARRQDQYRWEWVRYFDRMARNHARLAEEHAARAEALMEPGRG